MARNHEKQYGRLNRLILSKENEEYEKRHPQRPRLNTLDTPEEIQKWLPSIKEDLIFYLKKSQVTCYSEEHIEECKVKINSLEKEYKAFVRKIAQLTPGKLDAVPWTNRAYKRKITDPPVEAQCTKKEFIPIATPILDKEQPSAEETCIMIPDLPLMNRPLSFYFDKEKSSNPKATDSTHITDFSSNIDFRNSIHIDSIKTADVNSNCASEKLSHDGTYRGTRQDYVTSSSHFRSAAKLVNYDSSSDSDS